MCSGYFYVSRSSLRPPPGRSIRCLGRTPSRGGQSCMRKMFTGNIFFLKKASKDSRIQRVRRRRTGSSQSGIKDGFFRTWQCIQRVDLSWSSQFQPGILLQGKSPRHWCRRRDSRWRRSRAWPGWAQGSQRCSRRRRRPAGPGCRQSRVDIPEHRKGKLIPEDCRSMYSG